MKVVLRGKFIALSAHIKKTKKAHISNLIAHINALEKEEADSLMKSRRLEIIKLRDKMNKRETQKTIHRINERAVSLRKSTRLTNPYPN